MSTKLFSIFASVLGIPAGDISDSTNFDSVETWDSMTHMILINEIEAQFQLELSGDEIADIKTIGDAKRILAGRGADL
jgi:acyl carrier protein